MYFDYVHPNFVHPDLPILQRCVLHCGFQIPFTSICAARVLLGVGPPAGVVNLPAATPPEAITAPYLGVGAHEPIAMLC